jgi:hypothetical protein
MRPAVAAARTKPERASLIALNGGADVYRRPELAADRLEA